MERNAMEKKILAIHDNNLLFPDAPNLYQWLADKRGVGDEMKKLQKQYESGKKIGPLLLRETYSLAMNGLTKEELNWKYFWYYSADYQGINEQIVENSFQKLRRLLSKYNIFIFTSLFK